ncbi:hypothetical protein HN011_006771, partial [Eciton burchellii]
KNSIRKIEETDIDERRCICCLAPFLIENGIRCNICNATSCRKACSRWDTINNAWHCIFCHKERLWLKRHEKWFENFGDAMNETEELHSFFGTAKSRVHIAGHTIEILNGERHQKIREKEHMIYAIQNFIQKIVEDLVDSVDNTSIDRIYRNSE